MFVLLGNRSDETLSKQEIHHQAENLNLMFGFLSSPTITRLHLHRQFSSRLTSIWRATPISVPDGATATASSSHEQQKLELLDVEGDK